LRREAPPQHQVRVTTCVLCSQCSAHGCKASFSRQCCEFHHGFRHELFSGKVSTSSGHESSFTCVLRWRKMPFVKMFFSWVSYECCS